MAASLLNCARRAGAICLILLLAGDAAGQLTNTRRAYRFEVRLTKPINSRTAKSDQSFEAKVVRSVAGDKLAPDTPVAGKLILAQRAGEKYPGPGILTLRLTSVAGTPVSSSRLHWVGATGQDPPNSTAEADIGTEKVLLFSVTPTSTPRD